MDNQTVTHTTINSRYRIVIEQAASTKGILGFKVEANGDDLAVLFEDIQRMKNYAATITATALPPEAKP